LQREQFRESILLDANWEDAHFAYGHYLDQLYTDAKQREVRDMFHGFVKPWVCDVNCGSAPAAI
jgi:hypothetical protein